MNYRMTEETATVCGGVVLHRIECVKAFGAIKKGDKGGWIEKYGNLLGNAWVAENAMVYENSRVYGNAIVLGYARVAGKAKVYGKAWVSGDALVYGNATVSGETHVTGDACVESLDDYCCFQCFGSRNGTTTAARSKDGGAVVYCGCFSGTLEEFEDRVRETHKDNPKHLGAYLAMVEMIKIKFEIDLQNETMETKTKLKGGAPGNG